MKSLAQASNDHLTSSTTKWPLLMGIPIVPELVLAIIAPFIIIVTGLGGSAGSLHLVMISLLILLGTYNLVVAILYVWKGYKSILNWVLFGLLVLFPAYVVVFMVSFGSIILLLLL